MTLSDIPDELACRIRDGKVIFEINGISTNWMDLTDPFIERIDRNVLNPVLLQRHLVKEIEIKNILDEARDLFAGGKFQRAIGRLDEVLYYDPDYGEALILKSHVLFNQEHFVKSLRTYRRAVGADANLEDEQYYMLLLDRANTERSGFPKLKLNIYSGDEHFTRGEFEKALGSYNRALSNPSKFKQKILSRLLDKKACALIGLGRFAEAHECFTMSDNDFAFFGLGYCEYRLGWKVSDGFRQMLSIDKTYQLRQALALNELGFYSDSLNILDWLCRNHFRCDDFYLRLLDAKADALEALGMDSNKVETIKRRLL